MATGSVSKLILDRFKDNGSTSRKVKTDGTLLFVPFFMMQCHMDLIYLQPVVAAIFFCVTVKNHTVFSRWGINSVVNIGARGMEIEYK